MLSREQVALAFELILQRKPESDAVVDHHRSTFSDLASLGKALIDSQEYLSTFGHKEGVDLHKFPGYAESELVIFEQFERFTGAGSPGCYTTFLGGRTRTSFVEGLGPFDGTVESIPWPRGNLLAETSEWLGVLKSVLSARSRWRILELGAGYGPWMVSSGLAAQQRGIVDILLYGVEADEGHVKFMHQHLSDNGFDPSQYHIISGLVGARDGWGGWAVADDPSNVYGGRGVTVDVPADPLPALSGVDFVKVFGILGLLAREPLWDLVHIDIQGDEGKVCSEGIGVMTKKVKWVVIGTHGREQDGIVMKMFHEAGWSLENEKPSVITGRNIGTTLELMATHDGVQVWRNPRLSERLPYGQY